MRSTPAEKDSDFDDEGLSTKNSKLRSRRFDDFTMTESGDDATPDSMLKRPSYNISPYEENNPKETGSDRHTQS